MLWHTNERNNVFPYFFLIYLRNVVAAGPQPTWHLYVHYLRYGYVLRTYETTPKFLDVLNLRR